MEQSTESTEIRKPVGFQKGNKLGKGGFRKGAGRKTRREEAIVDEVKLSARDIVRRELEKNVGSIMSTYLKLASSGRDPTTTRHAVDKIDPDETITVPTITINFVAFNPGSHTDNRTESLTPSNHSPIIDVTPQHAPKDAPIAAPVAPGLTFTDIKRSR